MTTDLVGADLAQRTLTYFALGGSGIRALEPLLHLCALGLGPRRLKLLLIDPDQGNAAVTRSRQLLDLYRRTRASIADGGSPEGYFRTEVIDAIGSSLVWSPVAVDAAAPNATFKARVHAPVMQQPHVAVLGHLFNVLFSNRIQDMDLGLGFRGVPSIGTVFMNRLREEQFCQQLLTEAKTEADSVFFAIGSVFGGTGAAALPVVGRLLTDGIRSIDGQDHIDGVSPRRAGAAVLLPYFTLPAPATATASDGGVRPEAALFAQNAVAALPTYLGNEAGFGSYYVLGDEQPRVQAVNEVGGDRQRNKPHYVEFFAALAALDFAARGGEPDSESVPVFRMVGVERDNVGWSDLPLNDASRDRLMGGLVAVHTFLTVLRPDGVSQPDLEKLLKGATWLELLGMRPSHLRHQSAALDNLGKFFRATWEWAGDLRSSSPALELANSDSRPPSDLALSETIMGHRPARRKRGTTRGGFEVFRHWNTAAYKRSGQGSRGLLEVMREGSESFAREQFSERINV